MKIFSSFFKSCFMLILKAERWSEHWWRFSRRRFMIWSTWSEHMLDVGGSGGTVAVCCRRSAVRPHVCTSISFSFSDWQSTKSKWSECVTLRNSTHTHTDTHRHTHRHTLMHTHRNTQRYTHAHTLTDTYTQTHSQKHTETLADTLTHTHTHRDTPTHTLSQTHTHTLTDKHTHTHWWWRRGSLRVLPSVVRQLFEPVCVKCVIGRWDGGAVDRMCLTVCCPLHLFTSTLQADWSGLWDPFDGFRKVWSVSVSPPCVRHRGSAHVCLWDTCSRASSLIVY